jgi:hypothetical protein
MRRIKNMKHPHKLYTIIGIIVVTAFVALSMKDTVYRWYQVTAQDITQDLQTLQVVFNKINSSCVITGFDNEKNQINFLTVAAFAGSQVGSMNVENPAGWQGPYMQENLTAQGKEYQIVHAKDGYFILPGDGVVLPTHKIMGQDVTVSGRVAVQPLLATEFTYKGKPLAVQVTIGKESTSDVLVGIEVPEELEG